MSYSPVGRAPLDDAAKSEQGEIGAELDPLDDDAPLDDAPLASNEPLPTRTRMSSLLQLRNVVLVALVAQTTAVGLNGATGNF